MLNISKIQSYFHSLSSLQVFLFISCYCQMIQRAKSHSRSQNSSKSTHREYKERNCGCFFYLSTFLAVVNSFQEPCLRKEKVFRHWNIQGSCRRLRRLLVTGILMEKCTPLQYILLYQGMFGSRIYIYLSIYI